jgi:hypothetical protein
MAPYLGLRGSSLRTAIALAAGLCFVAFGYGQSDFGACLTVSKFRETFPQIDTIGRPTSGHVAIIQGITNATWNIGVWHNLSPEHLKVEDADQILHSALQVPLSPSSLVTALVADR